MPRAVRALLGVGAAGLAFCTLQVTVDLGPLAIAGSQLELVVAALYALSAAACLARAWHVQRERAAWLLAGIGILASGGGWLHYVLVLAKVEAPPYPSLSDAMWLTYYALVLGALLVLLARRLRQFGPVLWIEALTALLALAAVSAAVLIAPIVELTAGHVDAVTVGIAYPLADLLMLTTVVVMLALRDARRERRLLALGAAFGIQVVADSVYLYASARGWWQPGTLLDSLWVTSALLIAVAAWMPLPRESAQALVRRPSMLLPLVFTTVAVGVLIAGNLDELFPNAAIGLPPAAIILALLALVCSMASMILTHRRQQRLEALARRDPLTGLCNVREFHRRLDLLLEAEADEPATLALVSMDLNGFKAINDQRGHAEGDRVLRRIAGAIERARRGSDTVFRTGGDEFTALLPETDKDGAAAFGHRVVHEVEALGEGIGIAFGVAQWPADGPGKEMILLRADVAMYAHKTSGEAPPGPARASRDVRRGDEGRAHVPARRRAAPDPDADLERAQLRAYAEAVRESYIQGLRRAEELKENYLATVRALASAVEAKDDYTGGHIHRVHDLGLLLAEEVVPREAGDPRLAYGFLLHDIGKLAVPDAVLTKPGRLDEREWELMRGHPEAGVRILSPIPFLGRALDVVRHHHERWDGTGYPDGLAGEAIPIWARIFAVVDTVDAMTSERPYRACLPLRVALEELEKGAGTQFDPACVEAFLRLDRERVQSLVECPEEFKSRRGRAADLAGVASAALGALPGRAG